MSNSTVKLILWKYSNGSKENGKVSNTQRLPIYLSITVDRKTTYVNTGKFCSMKDWNESKQIVKTTVAGSDKINAVITKLKTKVTDKIAKHAVHDEVYTAKSLKKYLENNEQDTTRIVDFMEEFIKLNQGSKGKKTLSHYRFFVNKLIKFNKDDESLTFEDVTPAFLSRFDAWLRVTIDKRKEGDNYLHTIYKNLRTVFNAARKMGYTQNFPFNDAPQHKYISPEKDYLTIEELHKWEDYIDEIQSYSIKEAAIWFLFGCYSGLRVSDWYRFDIDKHVCDGRFRIRPKKTEKMNQWVDMVISRPLKRAIDRVVELPLTIKEPTINEKLKIICTKLGINKHLTTHSGRHTFAVTICLANGLTSETTSELMGITLDTFINNYSQVGQYKIDKETESAWAELA